MADFENATPFGARWMPSCDREGRDAFLIVCAARFDLHHPDQVGAPLVPSETQEPPPLADEYVGDPGRSSVCREGQSAYTKPATDVCLWGSARTPDGRPLREMAVRVRVGSRALDLNVFGDRIWERSAARGVRPSEAVPFVMMPLIWERAFGGVAASSTDAPPLFEPRNPVGRGLERDPDSAVDRPLPNIEDPQHPLTSVSDRPRPVGVTPVARHWEPRVRYAGTYDEAWRRERAPLWPRDFDERFFCGAPPDLQVHPHLAGGEPVALEGLHAAGTIGFRVPRLRLLARSRFVDRMVRTRLRLDGLFIDTDSLELTMYFRSFVLAPLSLIKHRETLLRLLEPWEADAAR
jgi:hypothetical protein